MTIRQHDDGFPLTAITGMVVWRWAPLMMLILLAGMQSLSEEIREAARVDGFSCRSVGRVG